MPPILTSIDVLLSFSLHAIVLWRIHLHAPFTIYAITVLSLFVEVPRITVGSRDALARPICVPGNCVA